MKKIINVALFSVLAATCFASSALDTQEKNMPSVEQAVDDAININQADGKTLAQLKGVGKKKAQAIINYRDKHGEFSAIEDLLKVEGIGKHVVQANKDRLKI